MIKKLALTILLLTGALLAHVSAQTATSTEKQTAIKELVALINGDNKLEEIMNATIPQLQAQQDATMKSMLDERTDLNATERKALEDSLADNKKYSLKRFMDKMMQKINYNELINEIAYNVYDKYFTLEELRDLNAFYKTATGQKTLKMMAPISIDTMTAMNERVMPKMMNVIKEIMDEDKREIEQTINAKKPKQKKVRGK